ncbi:MAG: hypothetical protein A2X51_10125 [Candidatus Rokubacteria bacterium GWC2_70_24]|nr:MAG: hypothetical protein A2X53_13205 [Candidatus Rokubacteria bacterium GWA2_70_23]OGK86069.1 MAG: hypothetical protein A2X51_10125 [Candidatus Rokubacteria bacterium GWC2_70_24]OGK89633.1 MAG: hypothetical protein A2X50_08675 [Candidatus Rokubacteria bacterium GWF2_70_14]HAM56494.1 hypothetical protein [Candidatus Rokubacteria bacterium]
MLAAWLGEVNVLPGRIDDGMALGRRALALARERSERGNEVWALRAVAEAAAHADPPDAGTAEAHYREALALAEELGARPLAARCHLGLGRLHRKTTQPARAREHLTTAITMLREMGMALWLDQASTELAAL